MTQSHSDKMRDDYPFNPLELGINVSMLDSTEATVTVPANTQIVVELLSIPSAPSGLAVEKN